MYFLNYIFSCHWTMSDFCFKSHMMTWLRLTLKYWPRWSWHVLSASLNISGGWRQRKGRPLSQKCFWLSCGRVWNTLLILIHKTRFWHFFHILGYEFHFFLVLWLLWTVLNIIYVNCEIWGPMCDCIHIYSFLRSMRHLVRSHFIS